MAILPQISGEHSTFLVAETSQWYVRATWCFTERFTDRLNLWSISYLIVKQ